MYYLKMPERLNLIDNGVDMPEENKLVLSFKKEGKDFETIKSLFSDITDVTVYGCIEQEDGRETDEFVSNFFDSYTSLKNIEFDFVNDVYAVTLVVPNEVEARLSELEDAINFMLMGGNE